MKAFITKYALTQGVFCVEGSRSTEFPDTLVVPKASHGSYTHYYHKPHWHENYEEAKKKADDMRKRAIISAERKIAKLKALTFSCPTS